MGGRPAHDRDDEWGSGEPHALTLAPSVDVKGVWHGFIANGALSPDVAQTPAPLQRRITDHTVEPGAAP